MKYLSIVTDREYYFKDDRINEILPTDISITDETYNTFFQNQCIGKIYKIKKQLGSTFNDIFEEVKAEIPRVDGINTIEERVIALENIILQIQGVI
ncbi:hypothetical protein [Clostridium cylindrosporum]|uniref:Uncharacterized protein n=1 Tax=Clostridium cylindrosporum DSM 605 TaxID=1121307 RepID=A0A0J8DBB9_CLOCY|nr:hypothetical protein [Clostridium cylindrosporum]KMT21604.1 hypothetical protein CLCY_2c03660 [Clostridium cylindrosporum DSM 605]